MSSLVDSIKTNLTQRSSKLSNGSSNPITSDSSTQTQASTEASISAEAIALAASMGITIKDGTPINIILESMKHKLLELSLKSGLDASKATEIKNYKAQIDGIISQYSQMQSSQNKTGASALASYNKASLGLS